MRILILLILTPLVLTGCEEYCREEFEAGYSQGYALGQEDAFYIIEPIPPQEIPGYIQKDFAYLEIYKTNITDTSFDLIGRIENNSRFDFTEAVFEFHVSNMEGFVIHREEITLKDFEYQTQRRFQFTVHAHHKVFRGFAVRLIEGGSFRIGS